MITTSTRLVALFGGLLLLAGIIELVRRRKLKEEYSVLWVLTALVVVVLAVWFEALQWITNAIGGVAPSSTLFFFGLVFVLLMLLHFSVRVSTLEYRLTALIQEIGLQGVRVPEKVPPVAPGASDPAGDPPAGSP